MNSNSTIAFVYCGVAIVSAVIMLYNARTISEITTRYSIERYVYGAVLMAGLAAVFDCAYTLREMEVIAFSQAASYILTLIYVICLSLCGVFWVVYSELKQDSWVVKTKKRFWLYALPLILLLLVVISTPFTHLYFYFEGIHYQRGPLFIPLSTVLFLYVVQSGFTALIRSCKKENYVDRKEYRRLFAFAVVYIVIQIIQLAFPLVFPYRSAGMMMFFEVLLIQNMREMIGKDPLTHISNRFAAERRLGEVFNGSDKMELVLLDIDRFKSINDQYGHQEGDKALQYTASALEKAVDETGFIARMGGDEFVIIYVDKDGSAENIEDEINRHIEDLLERHGRPFRFTVSAGHARKEENIQSIPDLIKLADSRLYSRKAQKKLPQRRNG